MPNTREKLIELLAPTSLNYEKSVYLADHLIANGVILPPCNVGQTVYYLFQYSNTRILPFVRKAKVKKIYCGNLKMQFLVDVELKDTQEKGIIKTWYFDDFGKTVFLTKEEAEAHLPQPLKGE